MENVSGLISPFFIDNWFPIPLPFKEGSNMANITRRDALAVGATAATLAAVGPVHAAGGDKIKVGLIGCGGRGGGAIGDSLRADPSIVFHAAGDVFQDRAKRVVAGQKEAFGERVDVGDRVFGGLDAFQKVIDSGANLIILATPPGFRPTHLEAAVKAGKHIFCEKPVAVDAPGIRKVLEVAKLAKEKKLSIVAGTQRRHQQGYIDTIKRIQDGAIGDITALRCSWNNQGIWFNPRQEGDSDIVYQIKNWYHFLWLCGDHITEQHVHNLDVCNWIMGTHPVRAVGIGGRAFRKQGDPNAVGNIYDHFSVEYQYANGVPMYSYCAHLPNIANDVSELAIGSKGQSQVNAYQIKGEKVHGRDPISAYVQEHKDLIQSIKDGKPYEELTTVAHSTMTAILGRMAVYSGEVLTWDDALADDRSTMPADLTLDMKHPISGTPYPTTYHVTRKPKAPKKK